MANQSSMNNHGPRLSTLQIRLMVPTTIRNTKIPGNKFQTKGRYRGPLNMEQHQLPSVVISVHRGTTLQAFGCVDVWRSRGRLFVTHNYVQLDLELELASGPATPRLRQRRSSRGTASRRLECVDRPGKVRAVVTPAHNRFAILMELSHPPGRIANRADQTHTAEVDD